MAVTNAWVGAVTDTTAWVRAKVTGSSTRLLVSDNPGHSGPTAFGPVVPTAQGIASITATGLDPDTDYWWRLEDDGVVNTSLPGRFHTHVPVGTPWDFTYATATCGGGNPRFAGQGAVLKASRMTNHPVFDVIREKNPLFFAHNGDMHYYDIGSGVHVPNHDLTTFRRALDDVLLQPRQHQLYREIPLWWVWDDHDYGPNNSNKTAPGRNNACNVYRERVPHYPLGAGSGPNPIYQARQVGRVLVVSADVRADRDPNNDPGGPNKTMLGAAQRAWLENLLETTSAEALVWSMPSRWVGGTTDGWERFQDEQAQLIEMFGDLGWLDRMAMVGGDIHALELERGTTRPDLYGGFPILHASALDSSFGGPRSFTDSGFTNPGRGRYGTVEVEDDGHQLRVTLAGWIMRWRWRDHTLVVGEPAIQAQAAVPPTARVVEGAATVDWNDGAGPVPADVASWSVDREIATDLPSEVAETSGVTAAAARLTVAAPDGERVGFWSPWRRGRRSTLRDVTLDSVVDAVTTRAFVGKTVEARAAADGQHLSLTALDAVADLDRPVDLPAFTAEMGPDESPGMHGMWLLDHVLGRIGLTPLPQRGPRPLLVASLAGSVQANVGSLLNTFGEIAFEKRTDLPVIAFTANTETTGRATYVTAVEDEEDVDDITVGVVVGSAESNRDGFIEIRIVYVDSAGVGQGIYLNFNVHRNHNWFRIRSISDNNTVGEVIAQADKSDLDLGAQWVRLRRVGSSIVLTLWQQPDPSVPPVQRASGTVAFGAAAGPMTIPLVQIRSLRSVSALGFQVTRVKSGDPADLPVWDPSAWERVDEPEGELVGVPPLERSSGTDILRDFAEAEQAGFWVDEDGNPVWRSRSRLRGVGWTKPDIVVTATDSLVGFDWLETVEQVPEVVEVPTRAPTATWNDPRIDVWAADRVYFADAFDELVLDVETNEAFGHYDATLSGSTTPVGQSRYRGNTRKDGTGAEVVLGGPSGGRLAVQTGPTSLRIRLANPNPYRVWFVDPNGEPAIAVAASAIIDAGQKVSATEVVTPGSGRRLMLSDNPWRQSVETARELARDVRNEVLVPRPLVRDVEVFYRPEIRLGDLVRVQDPVVSDASFRALVRSVRLGGRAGQVTQLLDLQLLRPTLAEHDAHVVAEFGDPTLTLAEHDAEMTDATMAFHDAAPLHAADAPAPPPPPEPPPPPPEPAIATLVEVDDWWDGQTLGNVDAFWAGQTLGDVDAEPTTVVGDLAGLEARWDGDTLADLEAYWVARPSTFSLDLDGLNGTYASAPSVPALDIIGDIDIRVRIAPIEWSSEGMLSGQQGAVHKGGNSNNPTAYSLQFHSVRRMLGMFGLPDGSGAQWATGTVPASFIDGEPETVRLTRLAPSGDTEISYWDGVGWVSMGSGVTNAGENLQVRPEALLVGARWNGSVVEGRVEWAEVRDGINGTVVASPDFTTDPWQPGDVAPTARDDAQGNTWTLQGGAAVGGVATLSDLEADPTG